MLDLEEQIGRVWNPDVRPLVREAYRTYVTGAARASILLTWGAVCADLIEKISRMAEDGDGGAVEVARKLQEARSGGDTQRGVSIMQEVERTLLETAERLELLDFVEKRGLERLREDRHLCAHPSLRPLGELVVPSSEYARAHLAASLEALLIHPPLQGRKVVDRFQEHLADPSFASSAEFLSHAFFDQVKPAARRRIVDLAAKHAVLELESPEPPGAIELANRMAACLSAFADRDRDLVREAVTKATQRLGQQPTDLLLRTLGRLGDLDVFWGAIDQPTRAQIRHRVEQMQLPAGPFGELPPETASVLALVSVDDIRKDFPVLESKFVQLSTWHRATVISQRPSPYFAAYLAKILEEVRGYRGAESVTAQAVLPCAPFLTVDQLRDVLSAWAENDQCRRAGGMLGYAIALYSATPHLLPAGREVWINFLSRVRELEPEPSYYRYDDVSALLEA